MKNIVPGAALLLLVGVAGAAPVVYTDEALYLAELAALNGSTIHESFEDGTVWADSRNSIANPGSTPAVASQRRAFAALSNGYSPPGDPKRSIHDAISHRDTEMHENEIRTVIVDCAVHRHQDVDPGLLEAIDEVALAQIAFGRFDLTRSDFWGIHGHPHWDGTMGPALEPWKQTVISCAGPMLPTFAGFGLFVLCSLPPGRKLRSLRPRVNPCLLAIVAGLVFFGSRLRSTVLVFLQLLRLGRALPRFTEACTPSVPPKLP